MCAAAKALVWGGFDSLALVGQVLCAPAHRAKFLRPELASAPIRSAWRRARAENGLAPAASIRRDIIDTRTALRGRAISAHAAAPASHVREGSGVLPADLVEARQLVLKRLVMIASVASKFSPSVGSCRHPERGSSGPPR